MDNVKIRKAKIKDDLFLDVEYIEDLPGHSKKDTKLSCTVPIHDDLKAAFQKLHKHLSVLSDYLTVPAKVKDISQWVDEAIAAFTVKSFSIGGNDDNEGITLTGFKEGDYGNINLNSPFQKWEASEYKFIGDLQAEIEECIYEVEQYLFHGKRAPEKQLELFDEGAEEGADESGPEEGAE